MCWRVLTQKVNTNDQNLQQFENNSYLQGKCIYFRFCFIPWSVVSVMLICGTDHRKYLYKRKTKVSKIELLWAKKCSPWNSNQSPSKPLIGGCTTSHCCKQDKHNADQNLQHRQKLTYTEVCSRRDRYASSSQMKAKHKQFQKKAAQ